MDNRVRITKILIHNSFIDLLKEYPLKKITVTKICENAQINRVTFYKYYCDVFDLYEKMVYELVNNATQCMEKVYDKNNLKESIEKVLLNIYENKEYYNVLFSDNIGIFYQNKNLELFVSKIDTIKISNLNISNEQYDLLKTFLSYGGVGILNNWIHDGMKESPTEVANSIYIFINQILNLYT